MSATRYLHERDVTMEILKENIPESFRWSTFIQILVVLMVLNISKLNQQYISALQLWVIEEPMSSPVENIDPFTPIDPHVLMLILKKKRKKKIDIYRCAQRCRFSIDVQ